MTEVSAQEVKALREATGAGMMDCKRALAEAKGDVVRATEILREKGLASAAKRAGRAANMGVIESYVHFNRTVGVLLELNCETDFVANTDEFRDLAFSLAPGKVSSFRSTSGGGFIAFVKAFQPVPDAQVKVELAKYTESLRENRANYAFREWLSRELERSGVMAPLQRQARSGAPVQE